MKKFLSILLAVMMVLSTVSFAAPSLAGTADTAAEVPVAEVPAEESADLAAEVTDEFGTLIAEINFNNTTLGDFNAGSGVKFTALGAKINNTNLANASFHLGSGGNYVAPTAVVKERAIGDNYLELTTNAAGSLNLIQLYTGASSTYYATEEGYLTVTFDAFYGNSALDGNFFDIAYNRSQQAEAHDKSMIQDLKENGGWGRVISSFDEEIGMSGNGGNSATMVPEAVNYLKLHGANGVVAGETFGIDNIRVYWRPRTADVTIDVEGGEDVVLLNQSTLGADLAALATKLPVVEGMELVGFSLTKGGDAMRTLKFPGDCTLYPVYEERAVLNGSIEFNSAADMSRIGYRNGNNNANAGSFIKVENGALVATLVGTDPAVTLQDTGFNLSGVSIPASALEEIEMRIKVTGMPEETVQLPIPGGGTRGYIPASVNFPQIYFANYGSTATVTKGESFRTDLTTANGEWRTYTFTPDILGFSGLSSFRFDFYDYMPSGSTVEIDYIRFIGKPVRVTVDNGDNAKAPAVKMDITSATTVAEVAAKYEKDHGDMKFLGLSRTEGGAVLAGTELVSAAGEPTTLYAVWDNYEYLTKYSVNFDEELDVTKKVRIVQNNDAIDGNSTYGTTYFWNEEGGYLTLKSIAPEGYTATWDHQVFVEAFSPETAVPAGVISEIAIRMRYRNIPTEKGTYKISGRSDTAFDPNNNTAMVHIDKYGATSWAQMLQSNDRRERNLVDGEWFTRYLDAETYFKDGLAHVRIDTVYPMPDGTEVDIDYIRFLGDNEDSNLPSSKYLGEFGEKIFTVDFDDAALGDIKTNIKADTIGVDVNSWLCPVAGNNITFTYGAYPSTNPAPTVAIEEKSSGDNYFKYTLNAAGSVSNAQFSAGSGTFINEDGYFVVTFDYKSSVDGVPFTFRFNKHNLVEDTAENIRIIENGEWDTAVVYYDTEIGTKISKNGDFISGINDLNIIKWHPVSSSTVGTTVCIDNFTLWFVPKTTTVTVDLSAYEKDEVVIKNYPTNGMSREDLTKSLPAVANREIVGLSLEEGGEAIYQNRVTVPTTVYPVYEKVNILEGSREFNSIDDIVAIKSLSSNAFRLGKNNALTIDEQYKIASDDTATYLRMNNVSTAGATGMVVDYGFWTYNALNPSEIKEIVIRMRIPEWAAKGQYTIHDGTPKNFDPSSMQFQFYLMDAEGKTVLKNVAPSFNAVVLNGEWFTYTIPTADIPADTKLLRFDAPDYVGHGTVVDVDYIRFYGYPEPDAEVLGYSAEFNENENGVSLVSWKKEDGTYMLDDGVAGDFGVGTGSKYIGASADYITWNSEGYVTVNFDATEEVKAAAAAKGATGYVYDASVYVSALDKAKYMPAGTFEEMKIRMRFRNLPADGTALYGLSYANWKDHTWNMNAPENYFYFHYSNVKGGVLYDGATATAKNFDGIKFTKGAYTADTWFEVTIPASYFKADVNPLEILRLNIPDFMPDGAKLDIDYIRFYGIPPEGEAPVTDNTTSFRPASGTKENAIRFKAAVTSATAEISSDIGWLITTAEYLDESGLGYADLDANLAAIAGNKVKVAYNKQDSEAKTNWFDSSDDNALVFAAALKNVPADHALDTIVVRPVVVVGGEYLYGATLETSLYDVAVEPYLNWISEGYVDMAELVDSGEWTFSDCIDYDFEYNDDYYELPEEQQTYIEEVLVGLLG